MFVVDGVGVVADVVKVDSVVVDVVAASVDEETHVSEVAETNVKGK